MKYIIKNNSIIIDCEDDFDIKQTLDCGQIFSYKLQDDNSYLVVSMDKWAKITYSGKQVTIESKDIDYFKTFFDLDTDYTLIRQQLVDTYPDFAKFFVGGLGIRILKQDKCQTIISFIVSANNNIKRIKRILFAMSQKCGKRLLPDIYSFPTLKELSPLTLEDYRALGLGYRSEYMVDTVKALMSKEYDLDKLSLLPTVELKKKLLSLKGVGPKVADCILFFGFGRTDVFPVDTWIRKSYSMFCKEKRSDKQISSFFVNMFGKNSGYAQQYIFNYMITTFSDK